jgi:hypothetical protein
VTLKKCNAKNSRTLRMLGELFNKKDTIPKDLQVLENTMISGHVIITSRQRTEEEFIF